jgi:hypothetical protein
MTERFEPRRKAGQTKVCPYKVRRRLGRYRTGARGRTLRRAVEGQLAHAYLFVGRSTSGRDDGAHLCPRAELPIRRRAALRRMPDVLKADRRQTPRRQWAGVGGVRRADHRDHASDNSRDIRICQVRHFERVISRTTVDARYRVVIVDPADALTVEAANAFLKTLEEPAPNTVLVLLTAREERLRETVRSRCRRVVFYGVPRADIERALRERWGADAENRPSGAAGAGQLGWAVAALGTSGCRRPQRTLDDIDRSSKVILAIALVRRHPGRALAIRGQFARAWTSGATGGATCW